jgi:TPR repeat protein
MRPYVRPLVVTFSAFALATLFSYAALALTEPNETPDREAPSAAVKPPSKPIADKATAASDETEAAREAGRRKIHLEACAKAEAGDPDAMLERAMTHLVGIGTPIDRAAAAKWLRLSAEKGNTQAQFSYGQACARGEIVAQDHAEAIRWFRLAAAKNNPDAELSLAQAYRDGVGVKADEDEALRWLKLSAVHGHPVAQADYALVLLEADKPETHAECAEWLRKSALQGKPSAMFNLAIMYQRGMGVPKDRITAYAWYMVAEIDGDEKIREEVSKVLADATPVARRKALAKSKTIIAQLDISPMFSQGSRSIDLANAFHAQFALAAKGRADDQYALATLFHEGVGTIKDPAEAAIWCRKAAEQGHVDAMRTLAVCLEDGDGVSEDLVEMARWYRKAAEKDDIQSQFKIGVCFKEGTGVEQDDRQAEIWTKKAADRGHPIAQANMGSFILFSKDESRHPEAAKWFKLSAKQGHPRGMYKYGMALFLGMGVKEDRTEGGAWLIACLARIEDDALGQAIQDAVEKLTPEERKQAEAAAREIEKTL